MLEQPAVKTLEAIVDTLVRTGQYKTQSDAIRAIAIEQIDHKIAAYARRVKRFETRHRMKFDAYTRRLKNRATVSEEDEWMEWEAAVDMLAAWQNAKKALEN